MPKKQLTMKETLAEFKHYYADFIKRNRHDKPALSETWNLWVDFNIREGRVSYARAKNWGNPFYK
jgi:hypothetical protein